MKRISDKKLAANGGRYPYSSISKKPTRIKKRPRSKSERERIYGPKGYVKWIHEQPCVACDVEGYSECAHIQTGGTGRKDDWVRTVPLCRSRDSNCGCHAWLHIEGKKDFEEWTGVDLEKAAEYIQKLWQSHIAALIKEK